ncbi:unnamed protein product [Dimorphilus gyrociliatus]|uniref:Uncharacterized protein n=1 Tax=Dimorphilus gyrociliatus TaxID=2664684 RepID=A0A7I8VRC0_9ANNE|nr:unnamed protein product [Dimorphilus gyrociliatus]
MNCSSFPLRLTESGTYLVTNIILTPLIGVASLVCNFLLLIIARSKSLECHKSTYLYVSAIAVIDLLFITFKSIGITLESEVASFVWTYSRPSAFFRHVEYGVGRSLEWLSGWLLAGALVEAVFQIKRNGNMRKSSIFILIMIGVAAAIVSNTPRLFEITRVRIHNCLELKELWFVEYTSIMFNTTYRNIYCWLATALGHLCPTLIIGSLLIKIGLFVRSKDKWKQVNEPMRNVMSLALLWLITNFPLMVLEIIQNMGNEKPKFLSRFNDDRLSVNLIKLSRSAGTLFICLFTNQQFLALFRRRFCCFPLGANCSRKSRKNRGDDTIWLDIPYWVPSSRPSEAPPKNKVHEEEPMGFDNKGAVVEDEPSKKEPKKFFAVPSMYI